MARSRSRSNAERMVATIYGIRVNGDVTRIAVYMKGRDVRLSGPHGSHNVHTSNVRDMGGWKSEATMVWNLVETIGFPLLPGGETEIEKRQVAALEARAAERKKAMPPDQG